MVGIEHDPLARRINRQGAGNDLAEDQGTQAAVHQLLVRDGAVQS